MSRETDNLVSGDLQEMEKTQPKSRWPETKWAWVRREMIMLLPHQDHYGLRDLRNSCLVQRPTERRKVLDQSQPASVQKKVSIFAPESQWPADTDTWTTRWPVGRACVAPACLRSDRYLRGPCLYGSESLRLAQAIEAIRWFSGVVAPCYH